MLGSKFLVGFSFPFDDRDFYFYFWTILFCFSKRNCRLFFLVLFLGDALRSSPGSGRTKREGVCFFLRGCVVFTVHLSVVYAPAALCVIINESPLSFWEGILTTVILTMDFI
jgi:hypothetical protein